MKNGKYLTVGTITKSNIKIDTPNKQIHDAYFPGLVQALQ